MSSPSDTTTVNASAGSASTTVNASSGMQVTEHSTDSGTQIIVTPSSETPASAGQALSVETTEAPGAFPVPDGTTDQVMTSSDLAPPAEDHTIANVAAERKAQTQQALDNTAEAAGNVATNVVQGAANVASSVGTAVTNAGKAVYDTAVNAATVAGDVAQQVVQPVVRPAKDAANATLHGVEAVGSGVEYAAVETIGTGIGVTQGVSDKVLSSLDSSRKSGQ